MNHNYAEYNTYANYFFNTTGCEPMSYEHWLAVPECDRPEACI